MQSILLVVLILLAISLVVFVLLQRGKGADIGAAFGSGASQTVFGAQGSASFLTRATALIATLFFLTCLGLAYLSGHRVEQQSVMETLTETPVTEEIPVSAPGAAGDTNKSAETQPSDIPVVPAPVTGSQERQTNKTGAKK